MDIRSEQAPQPIQERQEIPLGSSSPSEIPPSVSPHPHHAFSRRPSLIYVFVALILMGGLAVGIASLNSSHDVRSRASNNGTILTLSPATKTGAVGETFSLGITMNTGPDAVSAAELHLSYDPTAVEIVSFTPGSQLPTILVPETHTNGAIAVTLAAKPPTPFKGAGIVGTWTVKILAAKQSSIQFTSQTTVAALGKTTNTLASQTGSTISGTGGGSVTSTPKPSPIIRRLPPILTPSRKEILKNILKK